MTQTQLHVREWRHDSPDRAQWGAGPWQDEPDKIQWVDDETGLDCLMRRHPRSGHWCGYVGVAEGHSAFAKEYDDVDVDVHGGLTYSDFCQHTEDESKGICHVPVAGRPERVWWLGFDCAHSGDVSPGSIAFNRDHGFEAAYDVYRDRAFVESECRSLARQLHASVSPTPTTDE